MQRARWAATTRRFSATCAADACRRFTSTGGSHGGSGSAPPSPPPPPPDDASTSTSIVGRAARATTLPVDVPQTAKAAVAFGAVDPEGTLPLRATGQFSVKAMDNEAATTVDFRRIDDVETALHEDRSHRTNAIVAVTDEQRWQQHLMFVHGVRKTPKHLSWAELGREIECLECTFDLDEHKPEEIFTINFFFRDKATGTRDMVFTARNDVATSSTFQDLLAALGSCLGRADVHRTLRFDDGVGTTRELNIRKNSRYTSEVVIAFRPPVQYDLYQQTDDTHAWEKAMEEEGMATWGFHPTLMDPEYRDVEDPVGTYHLTLSAHALATVVLKGIDRLVQRPMTDFYRPSQLVKVAKVLESEDLGVSHAIRGWLGTDTQLYPHYTPMEALEDHWLGADAPFTLTAMVNRLREMTYLKPQNPEFRSWMSVRRRDSARAIRNVRAKLLGAGASPLFTPLAHNATVNQLLPKTQRRKLTATVSIGGVLGMPDETRKLDELRRIAESGKLLEEESAAGAGSDVTPAGETPASPPRTGREPPPPRVAGAARPTPAAHGDAAGAGAKQ